MMGALRRRPALAALLPLSGLLVAFGCAARSGLRAGAAVIDITPPPGLPMWGYGGRKDLPATAARDPLEACCVVLDAGGRRLALVGLDLGRAPARESMRRIRERARSEAGVEAVFVVGSHTHHGPCIELETTPPTAEYVDILVDRIAEAIALAATDAQPARIGLGKKPLEAMNRNRHSKREPKPVDRELAVLRIDALDGAPIATVVNFAAHPTTRDARDLQYSADYPAALKSAVEEDAGGVCIFLQGAAGDLSTDRRGRSTEVYGAALGKEAAALRRGIEARVPERPSLEFREEEFRFASRVDFQSPINYVKYSLAFFPALVDAFREEYRDGIRPVLGVAILNGDLAFVGASGEFFCAHALRLKKDSPVAGTMFLGYANGYHQYFPTRAAVEEGGYGADPEVAPAEVGAGEAMIDRALRLLAELKSGPSGSEGSDKSGG
jgi:hypothetical protein